jgi:hypothetical protein
MFNSKVTKVLSTIGVGFAISVISLWMIFLAIAVRKQSDVVVPPRPDVSLSVSADVAEDHADASDDQGSEAPPACLVDSSGDE